MLPSATRSLLAAAACIGLSLAGDGHAQTGTPQAPIGPSVPGRPSVDQSSLQSPVGQSPVGFGGSIGVTSDYVYRGISLSAGNPALQGGLHYRVADGWVMGIWGSHTDLSSDDAELEVDLYLSRDWSLNPDWDLRTTLSHYTYPDDPRLSSYDYDELTVSLGYRARLFATVAWSPNLTRYSRTGWVHDGTAVSYELAFVQPLVDRISASAGLGFHDLPAVLDADYWFWNVGLACSMGHTQLTLSYIGADGNASRAFGHEITGDRWAGSVAWRF